MRPGEGGGQTNLARRIHNVSSVSVEEADDLVRFLVSNPMISESLSGVIEANTPFGFSNVQVGVGGFHVTASVVARPPCQMANLIDQQLPASLLRIKAACGEATESRIVPEHLVCVIHECGDDVITAKPLIERRTGSCRHSHRQLDSTDLSSVCTEEASRVEFG
jgi:hypothetical protein